MGAKVSVLIPVYNGAAYIRNTLDMVLTQDYRELEVLVCDDASTDRSRDILRAINDPRVRLFQNSARVGLGNNWNRLIREATGDYILLVCQDDFLLPDAISDKVRILDAHPEVNLVTSACYIMDENGRRVMLRRIGRRDRQWSGKTFQTKLFTGRNYLCEPMNNLVRRSAALAAGDFDTGLWYTIDVDFWLRLLNTGDIYYLRRPLSGFRVSASSVTGTSLDGMERILQDEAVFIAKYRSGEIMDVTEAMIRKRERAVRSRLMMKILFMRMREVFS